MSSSIDQLPPELLPNIFVACQDTEAPPAVPAVASQVSVRWRQIALSTPKLWDSISVTYENEIQFHRRKLLIELWATRCDPLPIDVHILQNGIASWSHPNSDPFSILLPLSARIRGLTIKSTTVKPNPSPALDNITFPCLHSLSLEPSSKGLHPSLQFYDRTLILPLLSACPSLKHASLWFASPGNADQTITEPLLLPHLDSLTIVLNGVYDIPTFFSRVRLPALTHLDLLTLRIPFSRVDVVEATAWQSLTDSQLRLTSFRSQYFSFAASHLVDFLSSMNSTLTSLELKEGVVITHNDQFIRDLTWTTPGSMLPNLKQLKYDFTSGVNQDAVATLTLLQTMIQSRCLQPLDSVTPRNLESLTSTMSFIERRSYRKAVASLRWKQLQEAFLEWREHNSDVIIKLDDGRAFR